MVAANATTAQRRMVTEGTGVVYPPPWECATPMRHPDPVPLASGSSRTVTVVSKDFPSTVSRTR